MQTVIETPTFTKQSDKIWSDDERLDFIDFLVKNPTTGDVIPNSDGARKARWSLKNTGKRGGVRIIYFNQKTNGIIYLIAIYKKAEQSNMSNKNIKNHI